MLPQGTTLADRYEILERLGAGGYGTVYRANDRHRNRVVAIKVLREELATDPDYPRRFRREADIARMLDSRHVIRIYETGRARVGEEERHFQVMEFVEGRTLHDLMAERGKLPAHEAVVIATQVARALEEAENQGVVHRDIKPRNIFLGDDDLVRLGDFGIARATQFPTLRADDPILGTPRYMSPEQCQGQADLIDIRSDIYSLGVVLYEMLAGQPPFAGDSPTAVTYKHVHEPPWPLRQLVPTIPQRLAGLVDRCLEKNPDGRPQSARTLRTEFESILRGEDEVVDRTVVTPARIQPEDPTVISPPRGISQPRGRGAGSPPRRPSLVSLLGFGGFFSGMIGAGVAGALALGGVIDPSDVFRGGGTATGTPTTSPTATVRPTQTPAPTTAPPTPAPPPCSISGSRPSPCIEASLLSIPEYFTPGQPFEITVTATNRGAPGMAKSVSVSFPTMAFENLAIIGEGVVKKPLVDDVSTCLYSSADPSVCKPAPSRKADYPLAEVFVREPWLSTESLSLRIRITPPVGERQIGLLIRATGRMDGPGDLVNYPADSSARDQQGFKVIEVVIKAR